MRSVALLPFAVFFVFSVTTIQAETIHVYEGESIQAAIDSAVDRDEIIVHPGVYNELIDLLGKQVILQSSDGSDVTIMSGANLDGSVLICTGGEGSDTVIEGFTIRDGTGGTVVDEYN